MIKWIETTGRNEDAAIEAALSQLNLTRDDVSVEVLDRAKSGFLGIGSTPAKVKVSYEVEGEEPVEEVVAPVAPVVEPKTPVVKAAPTQPKQAPKVAPTPVEEPRATVAIDESDPVPAQIDTFLSGLLTHMGIEATTSITMDDRGNYCVDLMGQGLGAIIGRRGETLDAIQQLTSYSINRNATRRVRIHLDAEQYRAKRQESLEQLARKVADKVLKYRRNVTLESMNAYERHIIHAALQDISGVSTYSVGTEPNRRIVVSYGNGHK